MPQKFWKKAGEKVLKGFERLGEARKAEAMERVERQSRNMFENDLERRGVMFSRLSEEERRKIYNELQSRPSVNRAVSGYYFLARARKERIANAFASWLRRKGYRQAFAPHPV
jgi:hypothetical protein